jgi:subfamily B ATP-binding cassette protein MsbA
VPAGEVVAVTGPSGSGKSTLVRLLTRQLDPDHGTVRLDGQDLAGCTGDSVRVAVTVLPQETLLLDASVRDNIALARPDATDADVERAARAADAHAFVSALPDGYASRVGQRGRLLSGGQRQRLALARALLRDGPLLLLDEPTTGLDDAAADRFLAALRDAAAHHGRTVVVTTHDPRVLPYVDRVVALDPRPAARPLEPVR